MIETNDKTLRLWAAAFFLLAALLTGILLRVSSLGEPLWVDELHTAWCVGGTFADVSARAVAGNQSPLFFWLDYLAFRGLGQGETALRLPSLVAAIALMPSIAWIVFRLSGSIVGAFVAMFVAAIDDNFLFYSVEARPYALVQLTSIWQVYWFCGCLKRSEDVTSRHLTGWTLLSVVLFYLHYTTIILIATEALVVLAAVCRHVHRHRSLAPEHLQWMKWGVLVLILLSPGIAYLFLGVGGHRGDWTSMVSVDRYALMMIAHGIVYVVPVFLIARLGGRWRMNDSSDRNTLKILGALVILPFVFCFLGSTSGLAPLAHYRFSISSSAVLVVVAGILFSGVTTSKYGILAAVATCLLAIVTNPLTESTIADGGLPHQRQENWKQVTNIIGSSSDPVVLCSNLVEDSRISDEMNDRFRAYLSFPLRGLYQVDGEIIPAAFPNRRVDLTNTRLQQLGTAGEFWLVVRTWPDFADGISDELVQRLGSRWSSARMEVPNSPALHLFRFRKS